MERLPETSHPMAAEAAIRSARQSIEMSARPKGATVFVRPGSDQLFFVYTGQSRGVGVNPLDFFKQTRLLERNVVILQDRYHAFYQRGVSATIDSFDALLAWQCAFRESLPHVRRVFCLGTSLGGYAAILAGRFLNADQVWAFGPMTVLPDVPSLRGVTVAPERRDLRLALAADQGATTYAVYYNEREEHDAEDARRLAKHPRVRLWPKPGDGHNVVKTLLERGELETLLPPVS
jgi:hypothetical protein